MKNSCVWIPTVKDTNGNEKESELFIGLTSKYHNREAVKELWAMTKIPSITNSWSNIEYDKNGEMTLETVERNINIYEYIENKKVNLEEYKKTLNAVNSDGSIRYYDDYIDIVGDVIELNKNQESVTATIESSGNKFYIKVEPRTASNYDNAKKTEASYLLNTKLVTVMRSLGFDVKIDPYLQHHGIFDPINAEEKANGFKTIIRIAQGKVGQEALPEEFSHMFVEGLRDKPIMQRLLNLLNNNEIVAEVLGDTYDYYADLYEGNIEDLKKEAAAKILAEYIKKNNSVGVSSSLLERVWNFTKSLLAKGNTQSVDDIIRKVQEDMYELSSNLNTYASMMDLSNVVHSRSFMQVDDRLNKLHEISIEGQKLLMRRIQMLKSRRRKTKETYEQLRKLEKQLDKKNFEGACVEVLSTATKTAEDILKRFETAKVEFANIHTSANRTSVIASVSSIIREYQEFDDGFRDLITQVSNLSEDTLSMSHVNTAKLILERLNKMKDQFRELRLKVVKEFLLPYFGEEKNLTLKQAEIKTMTLDYILRNMDSDIGLMQRWITSMSTSTDPALALIDHVFKFHQHKRDVALIEFQSRLREAHRRLEAAGYDTSFMVELDENGVPTGRYISDVDYDAFFKAKAEYIKKLRESKAFGYSERNIRELTYKWTIANSVKLKNTEDDDLVEYIPNEKYRKDVLSKLSKEQREYYDFIMHEKEMLSRLLPKSNRSYHRAIFTRDTILENIGTKSPAELVKLGYQSAIDRIVRRADDTDFGEFDFLDPTEDRAGTFLRDEEVVKLDLGNHPLKSVPVFYTRPLEDMNRLSRDITSSMLAFASMAFNYAEFNRITDILELTKDVLGERKWVQKRGEATLVEVFKEAKDTVKGTYSKKGIETAAYSRIEDYYDMNLYGRRKEDEGSFDVFGKKIDKAKVLDALKDYTGKVGLGFNPFSALNNILVGKIQMWISKSNDLYTWKDLVSAEVKYRKYKLGYLGEISDFNKSNKMSLLVERFNILDDFWDDLRSKGVYNNGATRLVGQFNHMILNNIGEHDLHCNTALAVLNNTKVLKGKEEISLEEALVVKESPIHKGVYSLQLDEGVTKLDGSEFTEEDFFKVKQRIRKANQIMHGAFDTTDRGAINKFALGRLAMQFRQWMPMHYLRRFGEARYDYDLEQELEGYYRTTWKFVYNIAKELKQQKFDIVANWKNLTDYQKTNIHKSLRETLLFFVLTWTIKAMGSAADDKGNTWKRMLHLQLRRIKQEVGASMPLNREFFSNILNTLSTPAACINSVESVVKLITFFGVNKEIDRGRYKGWSVWERDALRTIPYYNQIVRLQDLATEDYLFSPYNK